MIEAPDAPAVSRVGRPSVNSEARASAGLWGRVGALYPDWLTGAAGARILQKRHPKGRTVFPLGD